MSKESQTDIAWAIYVAITEMRRMKSRGFTEFDETIELLEKVLGKVRVG